MVKEKWPNCTQVQFNQITRWGRLLSKPTCSSTDLLKLVVTTRSSLNLRVGLTSLVSIGGISLSPLLRELLEIQLQILSWVLPFQLLDMESLRAIKTSSEYWNVTIWSPVHSSLWSVSWAWQLRRCAWYQGYHSASFYMKNTFPPERTYSIEERKSQDVWYIMGVSMSLLHLQQNMRVEEQRYPILDMG